MSGNGILAAASAGFTIKREAELITSQSLRLVGPSILSRNGMPRRIVQSLKFGRFWGQL